MADAPENDKMDDLLKSYAKKRRADAGHPLALHPATRKLLQQEVASTYRNPPSNIGWLARLLTFWPRLGFAAATLVILLVVLLVVVPNRRGANQLARLAPAAAEPELLDRKLNESETLAASDAVARSKKDE